MIRRILSTLLTICVALAFSACQDIWPTAEQSSTTTTVDMVTTTVAEEAGTTVPDTTTTTTTTIAVSTNSTTTSKSSTTAAKKVSTTVPDTTTTTEAPATTTTTEAPTAITTTTVSTTTTPTTVIKIISREQAKAIALQHAGLADVAVKRVETERDVERGILVYEVEFEYTGYDYSYDIHAETGEILHSEKERDD